MSFSKGTGGGGSDPHSSSTHDFLYERRDSVVHAVQPTPKPGGGRRRSTVGNVLMTTESIKERQQRAKDQREVRRMCLTAAHKHIIKIVANHIGLDQGAVEEFVLDSERHMQLFSSFLDKDGTRSLKFYYQESVVPSIDDCGRTIPGMSKGNVMMRVLVTSGTGDKLRGSCVYFLRTKTDVNITSKNIDTEIFFGYLEVNQNTGILTAFESMMSSVYSPALKAYEKWGELEDSPQGRKTKKNFIDSFDNFLMYLRSAQTNSGEGVRLAKSTSGRINLKEVKTVSDCIPVASNPDIVADMEDLASTWCRQIEQILAESDQMRKEADDTGPLAELEHWRQLMARFNALLEQIKSHECRMVINILNVARSKVLRKWKDLDKRITDNANEAKDNVKFLYTLEKYCEPLYRCDPISMTDCLPGLINAIRMIHSISRYYNTSERMTSLFIKVTNQMVTACKTYINGDGMTRIWDQSRQPLLEKLQHCVLLYKNYQAIFQKTKEKIDATPGEKPFEFSEMYIFGKFETFCRRLDKIITLLNYIESFSTLSDSKIEGIEAFASRFGQIYGSIKKKPYDVLDQRKTDFDSDFDDFRRQLRDLEVNIQNFMDTCFQKTPSTLQALNLLKRFEKLHIPHLNIQDKYKTIYLQYEQELEEIRKLYTKYKDDPPIVRNMPPISGKIMWVRQLAERIQEPMMIFVEQPSCMKTDDARRIIKKYNRLAKVLLEYEILFHLAWKESVDVATKYLQVPVLVRYPQTPSGVLLVNFDPYIFEVIKESEYMIKLNLEIPEAAKILVHSKETLKAHASQMKFLLDEDKGLRMEIPPIFQTLLGPSLKRVDSVIRPGLISHTWTSLNLPTYFIQVKEALAELQIIVKQICDIKTTRIDYMLKEISETLLCDLPERHPLTVSEFLQKMEEYTDQMAMDINKMSQVVEDAVKELVRIFLQRAHLEQSLLLESEGSSDRSDTTSVSTKLSAMTESDVIPVHEESDVSDEQQIREACDELREFFNHRLVESLLKATRHSLDMMRRRFFSGGRRSTLMHFDESVGGANDGSRIPFFTADITLAIPNVVMQPSVEDIQTALNKATQLVLDISKGVYQWGQDREKQHVVINNHHSHSTLHGVGQDMHTLIRQIEIPLKHYYKSIVDNKDVAKYVMMMSSALSTLKPEVSEALQRYSDYSFLWEQDRVEAVKEFMREEPILSEFKAKCSIFKNLENNIDDIQASEIVGPIELFTEPLKLALRVEIKAWKLMFGKELNKKYREKMEGVLNFVDDYTKRLARPIRDLEDVRESMSALSDIREHQIALDMQLGPIEESYAMLNEFEVVVKKEETDMVDSLRYSFQKLLTSANKIQDELVRVQPGFKSELLTSVEIFQKDVTDFGLSYATEGPMCEGISPTEANDRLTVYQSQFDELFNKYGIYSAGEQLFGLSVTEYPGLMRIKKELGLLQKLYGLYSNVMTVINGYFDILWTEVDIEKINSELNDMQNRCRRLPKALKEWQAYQDLKQKIDDFSESCPLLELMSNKAMKERHWDRIAKLTGHTFDFDSENFTLRDIMKAPLLKHKEDIEDVCISAVKEKDIEAKLAQVVSDWTGRILSFSNFKARGELLLKGGETSEIITFLEDSLMVLSSLLSNRYNAPFKKTIQEWVAKLSNTTDILENWLIVQNLWVYLEAVFVGGDIAKQLPQEAKRFQNIDKSWVKIMLRAHECNNVVQCCVGDETLGQLLPHLLEQLELCQKSLTGYLEKKRLVFPRFFFVSDPALLEILGQASDSHTIQSHLLGVFENVNEVEFHEKDYDRMLSVISREGEKVMLESPVNAKGNVEIWLGDLLKEQMKSLHGVIRDAWRNIITPEFELMGFMANFPAQVGLLGIQMIWTKDAEFALQHARGDKKIMPTTNQRFLDMLNRLIEQTTHDLTKVERVKYETLVTIHVHQRDIFDDLTRMHIKSPTDFEWLKQARFYFKEDTDQCIVQITDVDFIYQNEFLGCTDRLVITPLTDRCYITLAQALGMSMGGAPAGPAGTGKTETTKDMGKALGKYVVVFNCSDQMDFRGLGRIYKGLAQSGSWGCFDEFNRIELPVLSVAAQQIYIVLNAKKDRKKEFIFTDGDVVELNQEFGIFLTMNPGYAGRQELPENLKVQFRTVAMMVPDRQIIMRVKLASCGFLENVLLAQKFYTLYKLCEEQLSKQVHYDFGLRNILSVLRTLGANKRARPNDTENTIVMRVLRDMNLSKLVDEDEPLFMSLIADLFPGIVLDSATYAELQVAIAKQVDDAVLINHPSWNLKLVQLYETQRVRHGMMTLGPSGAGKTCCIHVLMKAMTDCGAPHREMRMNPKAITAPQMFGRLDVATNDWTDGIFSTLWRRTLKAKKGENIWIVLDGPVDAIWIENLNSVLDDNKTLTLANGDRIPMSPACKVVFEVHNIDNASPATVSRNGMVYMSSSALDWRPILQGWLLKRNSQESELLLTLFDKIFDDLYTYVNTNLLPKMETLQCNQIMQACNVLEGLIPKKDDKGTLPAFHLEKLFLFSLMWSLGALLELDDRAKMEEFMSKHESALELPTVKEGETIFEYVVDDHGEWEHWSKRVEEYIYPSDVVPEFASILVPNVDNVRTSFLIDVIAKQNKAVLLIGEQGTAKTVMIKGYMAQYDPDSHLSKSFNFSSASTPSMFQRTIESYVDKRMGSTYGPPGGRRMTVFIDDVNMPVINEWGDQITNEITRQMMEMHGMYSLDKPGDYISIVDMQFIAAMIHPGGGRNDIPQRLKRQFSIFNCTLPSNNSIDKIFGIIGCGYFCSSRFNPEVCEIVKKIVPATRILWQMTKVLAELLHDNTEVEEIQEESQDQDECVGIQTTPVPFPTPVSEEKSVSMACQTESTRKRSVKIQVAARNKEKGLQVDLQPRVRSIGIQVDVRDDLPAPRPPPAPVPVPDSSSGEESIQTENETASLYEPSGTSSDDSHVQDINTEAPCNPLEDRKFIISETKLLELFSNCRRCHKYTAASVQQVLGTMVKIAVECEFCGFTWQWSSQPFIGNIPVGNIGLSAAILFSGALVSKVLRVLNCMGVATITRRTFNSHQSAILLPVIARVWDKHQQEYASRALERGDPLVIGGDGRADSPGHCAKFGSYSTIDLEEGIVIDIQLVQVKMLPTPAKFHYIFNLRDLSRIWEGMLKIKEEECEDQLMVLGLFKHECTRVIADRFTNADDKAWFEKSLNVVIHDHIDGSLVDKCHAEPYFVDFLRDAPEPTGEESEDAALEAPKIYEQISSYDSLNDKLLTYMEQYNELVRGAHMDLVFFKDAMVHLIKISRIIGTPRGNALLVGVGGSGKQSLTRLASFIAGYRIFQITLSRTYNVGNLMDDLKFMYRVAGCEGKGITFIFTDNEIKDEAFLEYLNNVLSSGEVSNLFAKDELDEITQELIAVMKKELPRCPPTFENLYDYFISRARKNLHTVLCFSPVGEKFRTRALKFPGLISGCTMDWFSRWPKDALIAVSGHFLNNYHIVCSREIKEQVVNTMGVVHDNVASVCIEYFQRFRRQTHVTPKSYLSFLDGYKNLYGKKHSEINEMASRMNTGLEKLIEASASVDQLSKELAVKEKELAVANIKADKVLAEVTVSATAAEKVKSEVQKVKDRAQKIVDEIEEDKKIAEEKLEAAKPALQEAEDALKTIKPADIATVKKLGKPPHLIMRIMDCALILFQKRLDPVTQDPDRPCPKPSWGESLKLMSGSGFLNSLQTFPKDTINEETVELLQPYLTMEDYNFESAKKVCGSVAGLLSWSTAMAFFYGINKEVLPLKANLAKQAARYQIASKELDGAQAQLDEKQAELDKVQALYDAAMAEKQALLDDAESCRRRMMAASALIGGLGGEKIRWTQQSKQFKSQIDRLVGDILLCTGFLSYSGPFNQEFRNKLIENWQKELYQRRIPFTNDLNLISMLVDNATIGEWNIQGLPNDELSIQNGIITTKATRFPLLVDPQGQGKSWIKNREKDHDLQVTSLNHKYFRTHLEDSLSLGRPLLIEDIEEELDPALDNVLEKNFIKSGSTYKVKVGDKECDIMKGFYLYMTTKLANPAYTPEVSARTSIIDFTVTMKGLEDQLLGLVILKEKNELEADRAKLMLDVNSNKRKMQELEDNLLYKLTSTKGSLVDDESLIEVLSVTKVTAAEVSEKLTVAAETEIKINEAREEFRPVATRGSILYFLICDMSVVNRMYQTSLKQFLGLFDISMSRSDKSPVTAKRIGNIIEYLTFEVFRYTCRGLYESHKFLFTLLMTLKIDMQTGKVKPEEFQTFIKGGAALDLNAVMPKPSKWISDMTWLNLVQLSGLPQFSEILNQVSRNEKAWKNWFDTDAPEEEHIPDGYHTSLDAYRRLLLIRSWCPDRAIPQARKYIADSMGPRYAESVILNLTQTWEESDIRTPLICLLSMGSDPTNQIESLSKKVHLDFRAISMGQGQEVHARKLIAQFMHTGGWALLQNCHLGLDYMNELLDTVTDTPQVNDAFRVWITTEEHAGFPISLLQTSIKFTNEPPQGIKAGLKRTYAGITQDFLDVSNMVQWRPMLFAVSFLHTVVQERRKFGPLGWNIPYEFNSSDWTASVQFVQNHLDDLDVKRGISWTTVRYMLGEVQYGGRVTDDYDKRLLNTFARVWFGDFMFQPNFQFYIGYKIPNMKPLSDIMNFIANLPLVDSPEAFGLHPNADITYQTNLSKDVLDTIMSIQPKDSGGGGGETRESVVYRLSTDMLSKLPVDYLPHEVKDRLKKYGNLHPLNIFLKQEIDRMQRVISTVRVTLTDLKLAIDGTIIMSENLRDALDNMFDAKVPSLWRKISWQSSTLGFWFTELLERNDQFSTWVFVGRPDSFWMTGFFNPQGFLTAMRQEVTRAHKGWALDSVTLHNEVIKAVKEDITAPPVEGVYVYGLYLDGAGWDKRNCRLCEPPPKVLFTPMPVVHMYAINSTAPKDPRLYQCPVYKKPNRTDLTYITFIVLKTNQSPDHWILRGVAALCDIK